MYLEIIFNTLGGLGIFLYGMNSMSSGMQKIAGKRLKKILAALTSNRLLGISIGILVTSIIQSSSVSTVMTVGFVNASLLTLEQALGVILGANIGTTVTGWLLVLNIGKYSLPIIGVASILYMFTKNDRQKTKLVTLIGFGFIFLGMTLMSSGLAPLKSLPEFVELFHKFSANSLSGVIKVAFVGALMTSIVQSSSATVGITITLASQGLIDFPTAVALVLGENVGTTITAVLASIGTNANAKRAAYAHTIINLFGLCWIIPIFWYYLNFLYFITPEDSTISFKIASAHTIFNITNVIVLIPFVPALNRFLQKIISDSSDTENTSVTHLNSLIMKLPAVVVDQTKLEIIKMSDNINIMIDLLEDIFKNKILIEDSIDTLIQKEEKLDLFEKEIYNFNFNLLKQPLETSLVEQTRTNLLVCDEYETISDYLARVGKTLNKLNEENIPLTKEQLDHLINLNSLVKELFNNVNKGYINKKEKLYIDSIQLHDKLRMLYKEYREQHLNSTIDSEFDNTSTAYIKTSYLDMLNYYTRASDHVHNIIEYSLKI